MSEEKREMAEVKVELPKNCKRDSLSLRALDSYTRELARKTFITVDGKMLPCLGFKVMDDGVLRLDVHPEAFEIIR